MGPVAAAERSEAAIEAEGLVRQTPRFPKSCEVSGLAALRADRSLAALGSGYTKRVWQKSGSVAMACGGVPPEQCLRSASAVNWVLRSKTKQQATGLAENAFPVAAAERSEAAIEAEGLARRAPRFPRSCEASGLAALRADRSLAALGSGYTKCVRQKSRSVAKTASSARRRLCFGFGFGF
ncbi:hypothetical protein [Pseudomonas sp. FW126-L8]|uniref:hypothetical protein n=1 Tax=Pseudomonas sp. FW126-L8 TaxID=2070635 RepID=UPI001561EEBD|nr:hypothetical protein [Pseudomonas sp. FW126-L8]